MKKLILIASLLITFASCKKDCLNDGEVTVKNSTDNTYTLACSDFQLLKSIQPHSEIVVPVHTNTTIYFFAWQGATLVRSDTFLLPTCKEKTLTY